MNIDEIADAFNEVLRHPLEPEVMIWALPEGTWLLRRGEEPRLLGEEKDFERIMFGMLGIRYGE
jgi:hypothetical protein